MEVDYASLIDQGNIQEFLRLWNKDVVTLISSEEPDEEDIINFYNMATTFFPNEMLTHQFKQDILVFIGLKTLVENIMKLCFQRIMKMDFKFIHVLEVCLCNEQYKRVKFDIDIPELEVFANDDSFLKIYLENIPIIEGLIESAFNFDYKSLSANQMAVVVDQTVNDIISCFNTILYFLNYLQENKQDFLVSVQRNLYSVLLKLNEEQFKQVSQKHLDSLINYTEAIVRNVNYPEKQSEQKFCLSYAMKCLQSGVVEKRLNGITIIDEAVKLIRTGIHLHNRESLWKPFGVLKKVRRWMEKKDFIDWLISSNVIELLYHPDSREQLILKGKNLVQFLCQERRLTYEHFDLIWETSKDQYLSSSVYNVLLGIAFAFSEEQTQYFWKKIQQIPSENWTVDMVSFTCRISRQQNFGPNRRSLNSEEVMEYVWDSLIADDSNSSFEVLCHSIVPGIYSMLQLQKPPALKTIEFFDGIISRIKTDDSVVQSITLLTKVIEAHGRNNGFQHVTFDTVPSTKGGLIKVLNENFDLVKELVLELCRYKKFVSGLGSVDSKTAMISVLHGRYSHKESLDRRLALISMCIRCRTDSNVIIGIELGDMLWDNLFSGNDEICVYPEEKIICYDWFRILCKYERESLGIQNISHIFETWLCQKSTFPSFTESSFSCFQVFFNTVNSYFDADEVRIHLMSGDSNVKVVNWPLIGIEHLWDLVLLVENDTVFHYAKDYLITLYTKFTENLKPRLTEIQESFLEVCMRYIVGNKNRNTQIINRCTILLQQFLKITENEPVFESNITEESPVQMEWNNIAIEEEDEMKKQQIMEVFQVDEAVAMVALKKAHFSLNTAITMMLDPFEKMKIMEEASQYQPIIEPEEDKSESVHEYIPPSHYVVDNEYFNVLMDILSLKGVDHARVWDVVNSLPANTNMEEMLNELNDPDFPEIFNIDAPFQLLYSLQIVDSLMASQEEIEESEEFNNIQEWYTRFLHSGGLKFLYGLLTDLSSATKFPKVVLSCISHLLKILITFFVALLKELKIVALVSYKCPIIQMDNESIDIIKEIVDFQKFINSLLYIARTICIRTPNNMEERKIEAEVIANSLYIISRIVITSPDLIEIVINFGEGQFEEFLLNLLKSRNKGIRNSSFEGFYTLVSNYMFQYNYEEGVLRNPSNSFLEILIKNIPYGTNTECEEFFKLLVRLIEHRFRNDFYLKSSDNFDFTNLYYITFEEILHRDPEISEDHKDQVLGGALDILLCLLVNDTNLIEDAVERDLASILFHMLLTPPGTAVNLKCKSGGTRHSAFEVIIEICKYSVEQENKIIKLLLPFHDTKRVHNVNVRNALLKKENFVGIKNIGSICYSSSVMQQFFMIPSLRNSIFNVDSIESGSILESIQNMFAHLEISDRQDYDPTPFCIALGIDPRVQQDAEEFFNMICDRVETELKGTNQDGIISDTFKGTLHRELICDEDNSHISEGWEDVYTLSVEIKNKKDIHEALSSFFGGEKITSFKCDSCEAEVSVTKKYSLKTLPRTMIIHLKRFDFDLSLMMKKKLNIRISYPIEETLNVQEFMSEKSEEYPPNYYEYKLSGVLVHSGNADSGHYYSFIKDRSNYGDSWFRFDDSVVNNFNPDDLPNETFGSDTPCSLWEEETTLPDRTVYMLFYERSDVDESTSVQISSVPVGLEDTIQEDNIRFISERLRYDTYYFKFLKNMMNNINISRSIIETTEDNLIFETIKMFTVFVMDTLKLDRFESDYVEWTSILRSLYSKHVPACKWLLYVLCNCKRDWLYYHLLECNSEYIRDEFCALVATCLTTLSPYEETLYPKEYENESLPHEYLAPLDDYPYHNYPPTENPDIKNCPPYQEPDLTKLMEECISITFMEYMLSIMENTRHHWRRFHQYFMIFDIYLSLGQKERRFMNSKELISSLIEYYMGQYSPEWILDRDRVKIGVRVEYTDDVPKLQYLMRSMCHCVLACKPPNSNHELYDLLPMSSRDVTFLTRDDFFVSFLKQGYCVQSVIKMVHHMIYDDENRSLMVASSISQSISKATDTQIGGVLQIFESILNITDSLQKWRALHFINSPNLNFGILHALELMNTANSFFKVYNIWNFLFSLIETCSSVAGIIFHCRNLVYPLVYSHFNERIKILRFRMNQSVYTEDELQKLETLLSKYQSFCKNERDDIDIDDSFQNYYFSSSDDEETEDNPSTNPFCDSYRPEITEPEDVEDQALSSLEEDEDMTPLAEDTHNQHEMHIPREMLNFPFIDEELGIPSVSDHMAEIDIEGQMEEHEFLEEE
eukprot:TRINITY_DN711_c6_g1_i1.p1 TRINITY_DN711_c6_g1~~TRINITY_DN711_c6_g1_i1.p1  ORF type:complete len:2276 (-),score=421.97 TRINITY_DN711_c6_g1_i1:69-6896(-)